MKGIKKSSSGRMGNPGRLREQGTEEALKKADDFNQALLATIPFGMEIVDENCTILFLNEKLKDIFGEDAVGKKCWELYRDNKKMCPGCPLKKGLQLGETETLEAEECLGGRVMQISHTGMIYKDMKAVLEVFQDITERKRLEKLKDEFLSSVSHEIRTPLTVIRQGVSQVIDGIVDDQGEVLSIILEEVDRLSRMINNILDISRIEAGKLFLRKRRLNLAEVVKKRAHAFKRIAGEKGLVLKTALDPAGPEVSADPDKIAEILDNLIGNALKFTPAGGEVSIAVAKKGEFAECSVSDNGIGVEPAHLNQLFTKYKQFAPSSGGGSRGTGLGLAIARELVKMQGGSIGAESTLGHGSRFTFTLPLAGEI